MPWPRISTQVHPPSLPERPVAYQEIVLGPYLADLEHRRARPQERAHVIDRPQLRARDTERDHRRRVAVHDRHHFGPRAIDLAMNVAFDESLPALSWKRFAVRVELHHVHRRDQRRRARARHDEALGAAVAAGADMAVGI